MNEPGGRLAAIMRSRALYLIIFFAIVLWAGPEYFAALELATLLELLGAALFLVAYAAAVRLVLRRLLSLVLAVFVPAPQRVLLSVRIPLAGKVAALAYVFVNVFSVIALTVVFCAFLRTLPGLLM